MDHETCFLSSFFVQHSFLVWKTSCWGRGINKFFLKASSWRGAQRQILSDGPHLSAKSRIAQMPADHLNENSAQIITGSGMCHQKQLTCGDPLRVYYG